ncbi:MAG: single-stranded-DNA-specific exonuclease RecJ [Vicinamibacteria bacterium]|nr:single-stranded-DNA-specific exonuclease RecJ [Vicinamibacteria bacterium]
MIAPIWQPAAIDQAASDRLARALGLEPVIARLLVQRGLADPDQASRFLRPSLDHLHDPMRLAGLDVAVTRLEGAFAAGERIVVHGDYDVDGISSTVILRRAMEMLGGNVGHFIPDRLKDGYGLQPSTIDRLHAEGASVVVSVDCGIRGHEAALRARELGLALIITDHHEPGVDLPLAHAVINPKRHDCTYPDKHLAGVGVALKLVQALCSRAGKAAWLPAFVKIAALGTLADVVPLVGENRVIAKVGLELLSKGPHKVGLRALLEVSGLSGKRISGYDVGFVIAPRINAAGRMATPDIATRLLLASDDALADEARGLAEQLNAENVRRQQEEAAIVAQARTIVERDPEVGARTVLVVAGEGWHRGVIGIVASKLVDAYHRPAVVLSIEGDVAQGSCRSIPSFDMLAALESCAPLLDRFGGHKAAAGLALSRGRIREFRGAVNQFADALLGPDDLRPRQRIDDFLDFRELTGAVAAQIVSLAPFGAGNPKPVFAVTGVEIVDGPRRLKERHLKMAVRQDGRVLRAIAWRGVERYGFLENHRAPIDLAYSLEQNEFNGETYLELVVADVRPSVAASPEAATCVAMEPAS